MSYHNTYDLSPNISTAREQSQAGVLARFIENWRARQAVRKLLSFDNHMLSDAGLTTYDVRWASNLPLRINASLALEERTRKSSKL